VISDQSEFFLNSKDGEDHAVLLCSLLLGFGLNAYVCVGTKAKGAAHTWVMTISPEGEVTFWESLTAHRYVVLFVSRTIFSNKIHIPHFSFLQS